MKRENKRGAKFNKHNLKRKGLSPVISTIILIMIVIIIAIIILILFNTFMKEVILKEGKRAEDVCSQLTLKPMIDEIGTYGISNEGNIPVYSIIIKTSITDGSSKNDGPIQILLNPGFSKKIDNSNLNDYESVKIIPVLLGKVAKSGLAKTFECPEKYALIIK